MKSEVKTVINKPCWLIYHIRSNDDRAKELTESPVRGTGLRDCGTRPKWGYFSGSHESEKDCGNKNTLNYHAVNIWYARIQQWANDKAQLSLTRWISAKEHLENLNSLENHQWHAKWSFIYIILWIDVRFGNEPKKEKENEEKMNLFSLESFRKYCMQI